MAEIILAASSSSRKALLENAGVAFTTRPAFVDERAIERPLAEAGHTSAEIATALAEAKALAGRIKLPPTLAKVPRGEGQPSGVRGETNSERGGENSAAAKAKGAGPKRSHRGESKGKHSIRAVAMEPVLAANLQAEVSSLEAEVARLRQLLPDSLLQRPPRPPQPVRRWRRPAPQGR